MNMRFEPADGLAGELARPGRQVDLPSRRAARRDGLRAGADRELPARGRHDLHAARPCGRWARSSRSTATTSSSAAPGCARRASRSEPIDVGNAGTLLRLLPGWLAAQEGRSFTLDGDDVDPPPPGRPDRRAAAPDGRRARTRPRALRRRLTIHGARLRAISYELPVASAQVKSCVLLAGLAADGATTVGEPARSRDHTERMLLRGRRRNPPQRPARHRRQRRRAAARRASTVPGDPSSAAFLIAAGVLVPGSRLLIERRRRQLDAHRLPAHPAAHARDRARRSRGRRRASSRRGEPISDLDVAHGALEGTVVEPDEVPLAIDELPLVALLGCFAEGETVVRGRPGAAGEGVRPDRRRGRGPARPGRRHRGHRRRLRGARHAAACAAGVIDARGDHRLAMMGAVAGLASREGVEVHRDGCRRGLLPDVRRRPARSLGRAEGGPRAQRYSRGGRAVFVTGHCVRSGIDTYMPWRMRRQGGSPGGHSDRRPRRRRQVDGRAGARRGSSASPTWTAARCTAAWRCCRCATPTAEPGGLARGGRDRAGQGGRGACSSTARTSRSRIRAPEVSEAASRRGRRARPCARRWSPSSAR